MFQKYLTTLFLFNLFLYKQSLKILMFLVIKAFFNKTKE